MSFTVSGKEVTQALSDIKKIVATNIEFVSIEYRKGKLKFGATNKENSRALVILDAKGSGKMKFGANVEVLSGVCSKRQELTFNRIDESTISYKEEKSNYKGNFVAVPYVKVDVITEEVRKNQKMSPKLRKRLLDLLPVIAIQPFFPEESLAIQVRANDKETVFACADKYHAAIYKGKGCGELEINIPVQHAQLLSGLIDPKRETYLAADASSLYFWDGRSEVCLPLVSTNWPLDDILSGAIRESKYSGTFSANQLSLILGNLGALYEDKSSLKFELSKSSIHISIKTSYGKAKDNLQMEASKLPEGSVLQIEPNIFNELSSKLEGSVEIFFHQGEKKGEFNSIELRRKLHKGVLYLSTITAG